MLRRRNKKKGNKVERLLVADPLVEEEKQKTDIREYSCDNISESQKVLKMKITFIW